MNRNACQPDTSASLLPTDFRVISLTIYEKSQQFLRYINQVRERKIET